MAAPVDIGTLIERSEVRDYRPRIAGSGVTVMRIAGWTQMGYSPEKIWEQFPHLSLAGIHAALAYYHANREEIDADIAQEKAAAEHLEKEMAVKR